MGAALIADNRLDDVLAKLAALHYLQAGDILVGGSDLHQVFAAAGNRLGGIIKNGGGVGSVTSSLVRNLAALLRLTARRSRVEIVHLADIDHVMEAFSRIQNLEDELDQ